MKNEKKINLENFTLSLKNIIIINQENKEKLIAIVISNDEYLKIIYLVVTHIYMYEKFHPNSRLQNRLT